MHAYQLSILKANLDAGAESEQKRMRPVLVKSNGEFNLAISNVTVLPLTLTRRNLHPAVFSSPEGLILRGLLCRSLLKFSIIVL
jgi:mRNA-degrading endonuclease toxin of MazEF toxin-antitoxin module